MAGNKPPKVKRARMDSVTEQARVANAAFKKIEPPAEFKLKDVERKSFDKIVKELAKAEWTEHQIELVTAMARYMAELNYQQEKMADEGSIIIDKKTRKVSVSPRMKVIQSLWDMIIAGRRSLSIHARAQGVNKADIARRNALAKQIEENVMAATADDDDDDFIARPGKRLN